MNEKELSIETAQVEIKVVRVSGHKMTISVFEQIIPLSLSKHFFDEPFLDLDDLEYLMSNSYEEKDLNLSFLGFIRHKYKYYLLFYFSGNLYKDCVYSPDYYKSEREADLLKFVNRNFSQLFIAI